MTAGGGPSRFEKSAAHTAAAEALIPGGAHTYAKGADQYPEGMAPVISHGSGCRVTDIDGNELVEFGNGLRSVPLGHARPEVDRAAAEQLVRGVNFVRPNRLELEAAERFVGLVPSVEMVKFGLSGSDATTAALKLARAATGRPKVAVCAQHAFFSTDDWFIGGSAMPAGIPDQIRDDTVRFDYGDAESLERAFAASPGQIAAVVMEAETTTPPPAGWFEAVQAICEREGAVFVLDEIVTGFRWSERGAQHLYGIEPDLCTFGKGMSNGLPLSALGGRRDLMELGGFVTDRDRVFLLSQTTAGSAWSLAAFLAVCDIYEQEGSAERLSSIGRSLRQALDHEIAAAGLQEHVRLVGRDCNLVYWTLDHDGRPSQELRTVFLEGLLDHLVLAPSFVVSTAHDEAAIDQTVSAVAATLPHIERALTDGPASVLRGRPVRPALRRRG